MNELEELFSKQEPIESITSNKEILSGKPIIKDTRISVALILGLLADEMTIDEILEQYPRLTRKNIIDSLRYAEQILNKPIKLHQ
ncbi:DUF433 domain-containing protein [Candidatus Albibeggiatoa sp. nov. BB20]|uniref:DUF433 domain-containing protein n=1 Tax=Candidatus Albibeggiatoa sp. nov. BB20 TaxID=3162723 RepID=UPI0033655848